MLGALLFSPRPSEGAQEPDDDLSLALFCEGRWEAARIECRRIASPGPAHRLLLAVCGTRLGEDRSADLASLAASTNVPPSVAAMAAYELGAWHWMRRSDQASFDSFASAFARASSSSLFLRSSYALSRLLREHPEYRERVPGLHSQVRACYAEWTREVRTTALPDRDAGDGVTARPALWLIAFYRSQIAPAIGQRCSLDPSCSEYAAQAFRRHGWLGLALFADRGVREPDVVSERADPVVREGVWRYRDPLENHDGWLPTSRRGAGAHP
jgi:putative component of membrane protein insertase Oxa1/YidC/SpoIIIJ protein YidD